MEFEKLMTVLETDSEDGLMELAAERIKELGSDILFLLLQIDKHYVPDVLWGQLYRTKRALKGLLEKHDYKIIRTAVWSDESLNHIILFEVEKGILSKAKLHIGPPVEMIEMSERFLKKHLEEKKAVTGPWIDGKRWKIKVKRDQNDARMLINSKLMKRGGENIGIPKGITKNLQNYSTFMNEENLELFKRFPKFAVFLTNFLRGRPKWLGN